MQSSSVEQQLSFVLAPLLKTDVFFLHVCSGDSGVWGLKKNFALLELLERLQNGATNQSGMSEDALKGMGEVSGWVGTCALPL